MSAHAPHADVKAAGSGDCGCGCGGQCGCDSRCCDLECLVRPRFFCGQLLTDNDLGATVDWARQRFALSRYRDGWGVVCGLDVSCSSPRGSDPCCPPDGKSGPTVYVSPGYALDCCGNDLVVCDPLPVDLGKICRPLDDPCDRPTGWPPGGVERPLGPARDDERDCWGMFRGELIAVDLFLRYHEDLAQGQRAMLRSGCSEGACEYTRVLERPCVFPELAVVDRNPRDQDADDWYEQFKGEFDRALTEIRDAVGLGPEGVLQYLRRHPPYQVCFLKDLVCCLLDRADEAKTSIGRVGFWLYLDWLLRKLTCACGSCRPDHGVPLARVLLRRTGEKQAEACRVMLIDPSNRRLIRKDACRPLRVGAIDLAPYLFQTKAALAQLRVSGVEVRETKPVAEDQMWDVLKSEKIQQRLSLDSDEDRIVQALLVQDPFGIDRVAAFRTKKDGFA